MSLFAVKNNKGEWLSFDPSHESLWHTNNPTFFKDKSYAEAQNTGLDGSRVVELVEKPAPEVVSEEEAKMLERVKSRDEYPAKSIHRYVYDSHNFSEWDYDRENRLIRAYVLGWTVYKPKRWNVKVPHMAGYWYTKCGNNELAPANALVTDYVQFTDSEIEQYGLQDCEKLEVTDDEQ